MPKLQIVQGAARAEPPALQSAVLTLADLQAQQPAPIERLLGPLLHPTVTLLHAAPGAGKTMLAHEIAAAVATGKSGFTTRPLPGWEPGPPRSVAIIDGELPLDELRRRMSTLMIGRKGEEIYFLSNMFLLSHQERTINLGLAPWREEISDWLAGLPNLGLVIIDNLTALTSSSYDEDSASAQREINSWQAELRQAGISVLLVHHDGKSGTQRGSSAREAVCDLTIQLTRQAASAINLAMFDVGFRKARFLASAPVDFSARLTSDGWVFSNAERGLTARLLAHMAATEEWDWRAIAQELQISKPYVYRLYRQADAGGLWEDHWSRPRKRRR